MSVFRCLLIVVAVVAFAVADAVVVVAVVVVVVVVVVAVVVVVVVVVRRCLNMFINHIRDIYTNVRKKQTSVYSRMLLSMVFGLLLNVVNKDQKQRHQQ